MDGDGGGFDDPLRGVPDAPQRQGGHLQGEQEKASGGVDLPWQTCLRVRIRELKKFLRPQILISLLLFFYRHPIHDSASIVAKNAIYKQ